MPGIGEKLLRRNGPVFLRLGGVLDVVVRIALQRPYTFLVLALLLLIIGPRIILRTPTDIFPDIDIPIVSVVWQYTGLPPEQIADRTVLRLLAPHHCYTINPLSSRMRPVSY